MAVALEFELAADILRTAIAPSWNDVGLLAAIIGLRTILNFFLQLEIDRTRARADARYQPSADEAERVPFVPSLGWLAARRRPVAEERADG